MGEMFDVIVIGGGPGGYVCALRSAHNGLKVACVDKSPLLGGTCLNWGCIPSKTLLHASEIYYNISNHISEYGIEVKEVKYNFEAMMERKAKVLEGLGLGVQGLMKKNKIQYFKGSGILTSPNSVKITGEKTEEIQAKAIVLATGSDSFDLPFLPVDEKRVLTSTGALGLTKCPKSMTVIGGGVIGVEMASIYSRLGAEVTVIEMLDQLCPNTDSAIARVLLQSLTKQGIQFHLGTKVESADVKSGSVILSLSKGKETFQIESEVTLVSIGRKPYSVGLGLEDIGLKRDKKGFLPVNAQFQSKIASVYAIGDLIEGPMLAHRSSEEGAVVADLLAGKKAHINYMTIPSVVYTNPEVATVGLSEEDAKKAGFKVQVGKFLMKGNSRARCLGEDEGLVKVIGDKESGRLLGVHIIASCASEMIGEAVIALSLKATTEQLAEACHAHPTFSEAIKEAAGAACGHAIHS